jgi:hypothetical protein
VSQPDESSDRSYTTGHSSVYPDRVYLALLRVEGQLDTLIKTQAIRDQTVNLELQRIREDKDRMHGDFETRLRKIEERRYVEPKSVWFAVGFFVTLGSLIVAIINLATR